MVMSFNAFDLAEQQLKNQNPQTPEEGVPAMDQSVSELSGTSSFDVAEQINTNKQPENWWEETAREITRANSRAVEVIMGTAKDASNLGDNLFDMIPDDAVIGRILDKTIGREKGREIVEGIKNTKNKLIPFGGQKDLQKISEEFTGGYTTPRSKTEEVTDEVLKTFTALITGGGVRTGIQGATRLPQWAEPMVNIGRKLGQSILGESAKEGVKLFGGNETLQESAKMATLFLTSLTLPRATQETTPDNFLRSLYRQRDALVPQGTMIQPTGARQRLRAFVDNNLRGSTPEKNQVRGVLTDPNGVLTRLEQGGAITMEEAFDMLRDVNRNRAAVMAAPLDRAGVKAARRYWGEASEIVNDMVEGFLGPISQDALQLHRQAQGGWAALNQSSRVSDFVMHAANKTALQTGIGTLFGGGIFHPIPAAGALGGAAAAAGSVASVDLAMRFLRNPTLRHYYTQVIQNAMRENLPGTIHSLKKLDDSYSKELNNPKSNLNYPMPYDKEQK
jgi:hypothetical protein